VKLRGGFNNSRMSKLTEDLGVRSNELVRHRSLWSDCRASERRRLEAEIETYYDDERVDPGGWINWRM